MRGQAPPQLEFTPEQNFVITLINYDQNLTDLESIKAGLPSEVIIFQRYNINYDINHANSSYSSQVNSYIDSISTDDWTSKLNVGALESQKLNFNRTDIFDRQNGTAIDVRQLENYLNNNLPSSELKNPYYIFVLNLSRFDVGDNKHWLNVTEIDVDSGKSRFWWRLEWDYPLNYDVKFPYAAFSESTEIAIIDPTSFQWYLNWREIWNIDTIAHPTYKKTLTEYLNEVSQQLKSGIITDTLTTWTNDWINYIYNMPTFPLDLGTSVEVQLRVVHYSTQKLKNELEWIFNKNEINNALNLVLKSTQNIINVTYIDLEQDLNMKNFIDSAKVSYQNYQGAESPFEDWEYYNGGTIWNGIQEDVEVKKYFGEPKGDITVNGIVLLIDNGSFLGSKNFIPWSGGLYTGIGGDQTVTMLWELDRAFMPDGSKKAGLSKVLIHEIGHAIGFPHTFSNTFTSDFASDVMGYYPGTSNFSQLIVSAYHRNALDSKIELLKSEYSKIYNLNNEDSKLNKINDMFNEIVKFHQQRKFLDGYFKTLEALSLTEDILDSPSITSSIPQVTSQGKATFPLISWVILIVFIRRRFKYQFNKI